MSHVSNWIVVCYHTDVMDQINQDIEESLGKGWSFVKLDSAQGGTKFLEVDIWVAALNYANIPQVANFISSRLRCRVFDGWQILVCDQDDDIFRIVAQDGESQGVLC